MKKVITKVTALVAVALVLVACGGGGSSASLTTEENGRKYHAFALATSFNNTPSFNQYHSKYVKEWGTGTSINTNRYVSDAQDGYIETMRTSNPNTEQLKFKENYLAFVKSWNEELPELPLYANEYHDLYNGNNITDLKTGPLWQWRDSIVEAKSPNDTVTIGVSSDWNGDFITGWGNSAYDKDVRNLVFGSGLLASDENGAPQANYMTESYEISEDQKTWTFKLKQDIKFSDGTPFTAEDVLHTYLFKASPSLAESGAGVNRADLAETYQGWEEFEAAMTSDDYDPEAKDDKGQPLPVTWDWSKLDAALANFEGFKKIDDYTFQFNLNEVEFNTWAGFVEQEILPKHYYSPEGIDAVAVRAQLMSKPLGSGPYVLTDYQEGQFVKFSLNEHYPGNFRGVKASIPNLVYKRTANETDVDDLLSGGVDLIAGQIQGTKIDPVKAAADKGFTFNDYKRHGYGQLAFHTDFGPTQFKEVRQAFAYGMDREEFIQTFTGGYAVTLQGPYSLPFVKPASEYNAENPWDISEDWVEENLTNYNKDYEKANAVMQEAGWEKGSDGIYAKEVDGKEMKAVVGLAAGSQDWANALNLSTLNMEKEVGIKVIVEPIEFAVLLDHYYGNKIK